MSLSNAINTARTGLQVTGLRADMVATNVSNATTPGYIRRSVLVSEQITSTNPSGVRVDGVGRATNDPLTAQRMASGSDLAQASVMASTWASLSARLGDSVDGTGLFSKMSGFESALANAAATPESQANLNAIVDSVRALASEFNSLSDFVSSERIDADREIANGVETVNDALRQIQAINSQLSGTDRSSAKAAALMDERQRYVDTISEFVPVQTVQRPAGAIDIMTKEGVFLLAGSAREIEFSPAAAVGPGDGIDTGALSGIKVGNVDITPGAASYGAISSGLFGALFTLRDTDLPAFQDQLDTVASDVLARLDNADLAGGANTSLLIDPDPGAGVGVAARISINPLIDPLQGGQLSLLRDGLDAVAPGDAGNGRLFNAMLDAMSSNRSLSSGGFQGSYTATGLVAGFASRTGQMRVSSEAVQASTAAQHSIMVEAEQKQTGVDVDAQMQLLLEIEQAYAANARVIEVANQMMLRLMEL
ncbi:flagellar hook-associated protein FlgK [Thalassovita mediterranea]|nr:flagellar hook-associated protein FlgK [Thalassovita mediterranea]